MHRLTCPHRTHSLCSTQGRALHGSSQVKDTPLSIGLINLVSHPAHAFNLLLSSSAALPSSALHSREQQLRNVLDELPV